MPSQIFIDAKQARAEVARLQDSRRNELLNAVADDMLRNAVEPGNETEIPGEPGHYEDAAIDYAGPIKYLNECGFDGYIDSEYEGQRDRASQWTETKEDKRPVRGNRDDL